MKVLSKILGVEPDVLLKYNVVNDERDPSLLTESAQIDPLLLQIWQKLDPEQRALLIQIGLILPLKRG